MFEKFGEFDSYEEINRAAKAQLEEGDLEAIKTIAEENGLDPEDAEDFCTGAIEELTTPSLAAMGKLELESERSESDRSTERLDGFYRAVMFRGRRDGLCSQKKREVIERLHGFGLEDGI